MIDDMMMMLYIESNSNPTTNQKFQLFVFAFGRRKKRPFASGLLLLLLLLRLLLTCTLDSCAPFLCLWFRSSFSTLSLSLFSRFFGWVCGVFVSFFSFLLGIEFC
jgi:hypothetical protein